MTSFTDKFQYITCIKCGHKHLSTGLNIKTIKWCDKCPDRQNLKPVELKRIK